MAETRVVSIDGRGLSECGHEISTASQLSVAGPGRVILAAFVRVIDNAVAR